MNIHKNHVFSAFAVSSIFFGALAFAAAPAFAAGPGNGPVRPGVVGKVASVSGNTVTVTSQPFGPGPRDATTSPTTQATTFTVDASSATVMKDGKTSSVSSIAVGDLVMVQGTVSGTNITATTIRDGRRGPGPHGRWGGKAPTPLGMPDIQGNGDPVIGGTVSAITGSSLTVAAKAGQTYTVNAANAKIAKAGVTSATLSNVSVGDAVVVQGTVNGTSVTASSVIDQANSGNAGGNGNPPPPKGFFGKMGGLISRIFGFF